MPATINTIIFDLGAVLIDWNPRYVYKTIFNTEEETEWFLANICTGDWNENQDAGYPLATATEELVAKHPEWEKEIRAFYGRWEEMLGHAIHEAVDVFRQLKEKGQYKFYALTNWSHETFPVALKRYEFLFWFDGIVVSGEEKMRKPYPEFYNVLLKRYDINPVNALFIDDNLRNVKAAEASGINSIHFLNAEQLKKQLLKWEISVK